MTRSPGHMAKLGRARVEHDLAWCYQEQAYLGVYKRVTGGANATEGV